MLCYNCPVGSSVLLKIRLVKFCVYRHYAKSSLGVEIKSKSWSCLQCHVLELPLSAVAVVCCCRCLPLPLSVVAVLRLLESRN